MLEKMVDGLGRITDNAWAFLLFLLAASLAVASHFARDKDILHFAETVAMTGAAMFHGKDRKDT